MYTVIHRFLYQHLPRVREHAHRKVSALPKGFAINFPFLKPEMKDFRNLFDFESVAAVCLGFFAIVFISSKPCSKFLVPTLLMRCMLRTVVELIDEECRRSKPL